MLGVGLSLYRGTVTKLKYITENLLQYFNMKTTSPELFLEGSTSFDGNDYITVDGVISSLGTTTGTWCAWLNNPDITSAESYFISAGDTNADEFIILTKDDDGDLRAFLRDAGSNRWEVKTDSPAFINNTWHHVALRHNGTEPELFVDGAKPPQTFSVSTDKADWIPDCTGLDNLRIGHLSKGSSLGGYFTGLIANVGFWNRAITQNELLDLRFKNYADLSASLKSGLISWYPLVSNANDSTSSNNGTNNNATFLSSAYGRSSLFKPRLSNEVSTLDYPRATTHTARAVSFDGSNDYITIPDTDDFTFGDSSSDSPFSVSAWCKMTTANRYTVATKGVSNGGDFEWMLTQSGTNLDFYIWDEDTNGSRYVNVAGATFNQYVGRWTHIVATYDGSGNRSGMKIYLNAESQTLGGADDGSYTAMENVGGALTIMKERTNYGTGLMNSFRIYSAELTLAQIKEIYEAPEQALPTGISASNLKVNLPMQEGSGKAVIDTSGNNNHGELVGATWATGEDGGFQSSLVRSRDVFYSTEGTGADGSNYSFVRGTGTPALGTTWSLSAWIYTGASFGGGGYSYYLRYNEEISITVLESDGRLYSFPHPYIDSSFNRWNIVLSPNRFYHIVLVGSGSSPYVQVYLNGSAQTTANHDSSQANAPTTVDVTATTSELLIGGFDHTSNGYEPEGAIIDEVAVWDSSLTSSNVSTLYNSGVPYDATNVASDDLQGYWKNEGANQWTDLSTNSNHLTPSNVKTVLLTEGLTSGKDGLGFALSTTDKISNGLRFNGSDSVMIYNSTQVDSSLQALDDNLTVECWIKPFEVTGNDSGNYQSYYTIAELRTQTDNNDMPDGSGTHIPFNLGINNSKLCFGVTDNHTTSDERIDGTTTLVVDTWYHVAVTLNSNAYVMYINGAVEKSGTLGTATGDRNVGIGSILSNLVFGARTTNAGGTTGYFKGLIDEFRIYNSTLSLADIKQNKAHNSRS
tara:strand:- start:87 stop:3011 length:2925 start_codon:yes stop_codon:yes gene_type:complete